MLYQAIHLIDNLLCKTCPKYTRKSYGEFLKANDYPHSKNTITRILNYIDEQFKLDIKAKRTGHPDSNFFYIDEEASDPDYHTYYNLAKSLLFHQIIQEHREKKYIAKSYISISNDRRNDGLEYLKDIIKAVENQHKIQVEYRSFFEDNPKTYIIEPVLLREYLNRWYVVANRKPELDKPQPVFALDRIKKLQILKQKFTEKQDFIKAYTQTIGASLSGDVIELVLGVSDQQAHYFKTLSFHPSQEYLGKKGQWHRFKYRVRYNFELLQWLKHYGKHVVVLEPDYVRQNLLNEITEMQKNYQK